VANWKGLPSPTNTTTHSTGVSSSRVEYFQVTFERDAKTLWLPREVTVSGQLERFAFSNQHHYSQYRLFIVEAGEKRIKP
jgi:hypothetical protein